MAQILADNTDAATGTCPDAVPSAPVPLPQSLVDCLSEFLPTSAYTGPMHFILTTRDGHAGAGGVTESGPVTVNLATGSGPFRVTSQSDAGHLHRWLDADGHVERGRHRPGADQHRER